MCKLSLKDQCTKSKNHQKIILRHIWEEYKEQANENRYTQNWKDNYPKRKETIERVFGDCKEQHNLRFTKSSWVAQKWTKYHVDFLHVII